MHQPQLLAPTLPRWSVQAVRAALPWRSVLAFALPLGLYALTIAPTVAPMDSAELTVAAPFGGVVASVDARVGETVAPGTIVVRVADEAGWRFETTDLDDPEALRTIADDCQRRVRTAGMPSDVRGALLDAYARLGQGERVAVRSLRVSLMNPQERLHSVYQEVD